jgi:biotin operon repressor
MEVIKYPEWKELVNRAVNWGYGSDHSHEEIGEILRLNPGTTKYRYAVARSKKELEKLGKALKSVHGKGYIVMEAKEYLNESAMYAKKSRNNSKRSVEVLINTPIEKLTPEQQKIRDMMLDSGLRLVALTEGGFKEIKTLQRNCLQLNAAKG